MACGEAETSLLSIIMQDPRGASRTVVASRPVQWEELIPAPQSGQGCGEHKYE